MKRTLLLLTASLGLAVAAPAEMLTLNYAGSFDPTTTLGGTALGVDTPFSLHATFDSTANLTSDQPGKGVFPVTSFSLLLGGTAYTAAPQAGLNVLLLDQAYGWGGYAAGLYIPDGTSGFLTLFSTATPGFTVNALTPTVLSGFMENDSNTPYIITLAGAAGDLAINGVNPDGITADITPYTATVPEPGQWAMMGLAFVGVAGCGFRRYRASKTA